MDNEISEISLKRIRQAIFAFYFCQGLCFSSWASRIADIKMSMSLDDAAWGTILLMLPIGQVCGMTMSGLLVSRLGSNRIYPIALGLYTLSLLFVGLATSQYSLIISLILFGFFGNFCNIAVNTQATTVEIMYGKPIMASFHGGWSLAGLTGASIGLFMTTMGIGTMYHYCFILLLNVVLYIVNRKYLQKDIKKEKNMEDREDKKKNKPETFLYLLGIVAFCGMAAEGAMADWSGLYLTDVVGTAEKYAPLGLLTYMITMTSGRFIADKLVVTWGRKRVVQGGGLLITVGLFFVVAFPYLIPTLIGYMIIGLGTCSIVPIVYSIAGRKTKISTGLALTIVSSVSFLGFLIGPPLIGYVSHVTNLRVSYGLIGLMGLCVVFLTAKIKIFDEK